MNTYLILIRGINVGIKNRISMAELKLLLEKQGFTDVTTYIASGNVILRSALNPDEVKVQVEQALAQNLRTTDEPVKVLVLTREQLQAVVDRKPAGFGEQPDQYHSDAIFLMDITVKQALPVFNPRDGVDAIWPGPGVIYSRRLSAERTRSRLSAIVGTPQYKSMTIRSWGTTQKLSLIVLEYDHATQ